MKATADVTTLIPVYKSHCERRFAGLGATLLGAHFGAECLRFDYEPLRFKVPGGFYTTDWLALLADGRVVFVEVKGSKKQKGYRDARSKLRAAAEIYCWWTWVEVVEQDGWTVEVISK